MASHRLTVGECKACVIIPAFEAARSIESVVRDLVTELGCSAGSLIVVDDGSTDGTSHVARAAECHVVTCPENRGKGAALRRGFEEAKRLGYDVALTVDADGQHPATSAAELLAASSNPEALVLGIRDLARDGAPSKNQLSNGISNFFLSRFSGRALADTQCGLRRYPVAKTLQLGARAPGYAFEAEIILRAIHAGVPIVEHPVRVIYPREEERVTHFDSVRDPWRIVRTVLRTLFDLRGRA